jgi:PHP family Zn ribbon phosphoesterase
MFVLHYHELSPSGGAIKCKNCGKEFRSAEDPRIETLCYGEKQEPKRDRPYGYNRQRQRNVKVL